jgi:hypothetical protein
MTIGIAEAKDVLHLGSGQTATWAGQTVDATAVLLAQVRSGDADLSGTIDADDYFQLDSHYSKTADSAKSYFNGDFNYDGKINGDDYFLIDGNFQAQATVLGASTSAVPEPATAAATVLLAATLRRRFRGREGKPAASGPASNPLGE